MRLLSMAALLSALITLVSALALQGSLLVRHGDPAVADAFCASRLEGDWGRAFGTLPPGVDFGAIIERHSPHL